MLPPPLYNSLQQALGVTLQSTQPCYGGDINSAAHLVTSDGHFFLKWNSASPPGMFSAEAAGLRLLAAANTLRVPAVIAVQEKQGLCPAYLVLEWLESGAASSQSAEKLGEGLAALHRHQASQHGLDHANFIGSLPQKNIQTKTWVNFFAEQRLRPQMEIARRLDRLPAAREKGLNELIRRLPEWLPAEEPAPSLLHGDLWSGNVMTLSDGIPAIIDPAVYFGHREIEIAFTQLFGGFGARFYAAYHATYPLPPDYEKRRALYQLYPLMVHMNLFGGGYISQVDAIVQRYIG